MVLGGQVTHGQMGWLPYFALIGGETHHTVEQRGLARPVLARQTINHARLIGDREVSQDFRLAITLRQMMDGYQFHSFLKSFLT